MKSPDDTRVEILNRVCIPYGCKNCPIRENCDSGMNPYQLLWEFLKKEAEEGV